MAAPTTTIWSLEPHTRVKHEILRRYLQAWIPILGQSQFDELIYIDGFAGPGRYSQGEDGSPVIAIKAALERQEQIKPRMTFVFVELDKDRADMLELVLGEVDLPSKFSLQVAGGRSFDDAVSAFIDYRTRNAGHLPPTFAFIDPFGWSGVPFELVTRILSSPSCEVLVTFMYEEINRFIGLPDQESNFTSFFGTNAWKEIVPLNDPRERNRRLHDLYLNQLRNRANMKYVRSFEMRNERDVTDYYLFYATNSLLGLKRMKEAMWRVDKSGEFRFSDATDPRQFVLFGDEPQYDILERQLVARFANQEPTIREIEEFVVSETAFRETHYKRQILRIMELAQPPRLLPINPPMDRRPGTYPNPGLRVRFMG